jgi:hypothetical protein
MNEYIYVCVFVYIIFILSNICGISINVQAKKLGGSGIASARIASKSAKPI